MLQYRPHLRPQFDGFTAPVAQNAIGKVDLAIG